MMGQIRATCTVVILYARASPAFQEDSFQAIVEGNAQVCSEGPRTMYVQTKAGEITGSIYITQHLGSAGAASDMDPSIGIQDARNADFSGQIPVGTLVEYIMLLLELLKKCDHEF